MTSLWPRRLRGLACVVALSAVASSGMEAERLQVAVATDKPDALWVQALKNALQGGANLRVVRSADAAPAIASAYVTILGGDDEPGVAAYRPELQSRLTAGGGLVVLRTAGAMPAEFCRTVLGALPKGSFAGGATMQVIDLLPHPILGGVETLVVDRPMPAWGELAPDLDVFIEGVVGEEAMPLAWVRRNGAGRVCHLPIVDAATMADPAALRLVVQAVLWAGQRDIPASVTTVQRTFMPEAVPGAFAICLPRGPSLCFDPDRGGVNYAWDGDFIDLHPRWVTKRGAPARLSGPVVYREAEKQPWRDAAGHPLEYQFLGYERVGRWVELHYTVGGRKVRERLLPSDQGRGIVRELALEEGAPLALRLGEAEGASLRVRGAELRGDSVYFGSNARGTFSIELQVGGSP